jgi:hypothetical protein
MKKILLLCVMAFICLNSSFAQCSCIEFQNPAFAGGQEGPDTVPQGWIRCSSGTEFTFPYQNDDTLQPYHFLEGGFVGLAYSDNTGTITQGAISDSLLCPLVASSLDTFTVALANISNSGQGDAAECLIYGGNSPCSTEELLYTVPSIPMAINNTPEWTLFTIPVNPSRNYAYITFVVGNGTPQSATSFFLGIDAINVVCNHNTTTGIEQVNAVNIIIYPNPATNQVTVNTGSSMPYALTVFDLTGREITTKEMAGTGTIDFSQLSKGCYLAKVIQGDKSYTQKLIIQ